MASKKFYSDDDIQLAKAALSELPDHRSTENIA